MCMWQVSVHVYMCMYMCISLYIYICMYICLYTISWYLLHLSRHKSHTHTFCNVLDINLCQIGHYLSYCQTVMIILCVKSCLKQPCASAWLGGMGPTLWKVMPILIASWFVHDIKHRIPKCLVEKKNKVTRPFLPDVSKRQTCVSENWVYPKMTTLVRELMITHLIWGSLP